MVKRVKRKVMKPTYILLIIATIVILLVGSYALFSSYKIPAGKKPANTTNNITKWIEIDKTPVLMEYNHTQYWIKNYQVINKCLTGWKIINGYNKSREDVLNSLPSYHRTRC